MNQTYSQQVAMSMLKIKNDEWMAQRKDDLFIDAIRNGQPLPLDYYVMNLILISVA